MWKWELKREKIPSKKFYWACVHARNKIPLYKFWVKVQEQEWERARTRVQGKNSIQWTLVNVLLWHQIPLDKFGVNVWEWVRERKIPLN